MKLVSKSGVTLNIVGAKAVQLDTKTFQLVLRIAKCACLPGTARRIIFGVKIKYNWVAF